MRKWSSGCLYDGQNHTAIERLRSNSDLSDPKVIFSLQMVNGTSSVFNQISMWLLRCMEMERKECTIFWLESMNNRKCLSHMPESPTFGWKESPQLLSLRGGKSHCWLMPRSPHQPGCLFSQFTCDLVQSRPVSKKYKYSLDKLTRRF